eukprot:scaffold1574_cov119-Isochrysis_galbana.AAC.14
MSHVRRGKGEKQRGPGRQSHRPSPGMHGGRNCAQYRARPEAHLPFEPCPCPAEWLAIIELHVASVTTHRMGPGGGTNSRKTQTQMPRRVTVTVGTLKRGPPLRVRGDRGQPTGAPPPPSLK